MHVLYGVINAAKPAIHILHPLEDYSCMVSPTSSLSLSLLQLHNYSHNYGHCYYAGEHCGHC